MSPDGRWQAVVDVVVVVGADVVDVVVVDVVELVEEVVDVVVLLVLEVVVEVVGLGTIIPATKEKSSQQLFTPE